LPHLEIGDYIETEQLFGSGPSPGGVVYEGPSWYFREKEVAYARSEFVLISPADRKMSVETTGELPKPVVTRDGAFQVQRWRVDKSPAAPDEPYSVPPSEFLPGLQASWGIGLERHLALLSKRVEDVTPVDPRIVRVARGILRGEGSSKAAQSELDKARVLYRWVLDNVQDGEEDDGRRVIIGKRGNRWRGFTALCRAAGIPVRWAVARNRLAPAPTGPMSEAVQYGATLLRVGGAKTAWVVLVDKYTPFGYLPPEVRGVSAYLLGGAAPEKATVPQGGESDRLEFLGEVTLERDGRAALRIEQVFAGKFGAGMRQGLSQLGERRIKDAIEGQILGANLRGARLLKHELTALDNIDVPLRLKMHAEMAHFALTQDGGLQLQPPYVPRLSQFAALPSRQTAILLGQERDWRVQLRVKLPAGARVDLPKPQLLEFGEHRVKVSDRVEGTTLVIDRHVLLAAGRITPERYAEFVRFARGADAAMTREISIRF
jgi:cellulose synthase operon protein C